MKYCSKCGKLLTDDVNFCSSCGQKVEKEEKNEVDDKQVIEKEIKESVSEPIKNLSEENKKEISESPKDISESNGMLEAEKDECKPPVFKVDKEKKNNRTFKNKKIWIGLIILLFIVIGVLIYNVSYNGVSSENLVEKNQYSIATKSYTKGGVTISIPKYFKEKESEDEDSISFYADNSKAPVLILTDANDSINEQNVSAFKKSFIKSAELKNTKSKTKEFFYNDLIFYQTKIKGQTNGVRTKITIYFIRNYDNDGGLILIYNQYNGLEYNYKKDVSKIIKNAKLNNETKDTTNDSSGTEETISQKNAKKEAKEYLSSMAFSRQGLINQLVHDQFSEEDATYAVDHISADWSSEACECAKEYLNSMGFSRQGLIKQLMSEYFSEEDATHAVDSVSVDWNEQAYKVAQEYLDSSGYSHGELVEQLVYEGFTQDQAEYGVSKTGL